MEVFVTPNTVKLIKKLPKVSQIAIYHKLRKIGLENVASTKLSGHKNIFRVRVGDYRIVYEIRNRRVYVFLVGHRKEIYRLLDRFMR
jgi:mRNA interferase RelE/StbE